MAPSLPYSYKKKTITLVLPHTFLIDNFRRYRAEDTITHIENLAKMMLISEIIIRKRALNPTLYFGATSASAIKAFEEKVKSNSAFSELHFGAFREALDVDEADEIKKLGEQGSIIAVADKLLKTHNTNPIIVARSDSIIRWKEDIKEYYSKHTSKKEPIAVFSVDGTLQYLKQKDKPIYYSARDSIKADVLKYYLPK